jgi:hypothetical protein
MPNLKLSLKCGTLKYLVSTLLTLSRCLNFQVDSGRQDRNLDQSNLEKRILRGASGLLLRNEKDRANSLPESGPVL